MKNYKIRTTSIDYCVEYEDVYDLVVEENPDVDEDSAKFDKLVDKKIKEIKKDLPQELEFEITCEPDELGDVVADEISDETNWLIAGCDYEILEEEQEYDSMLFPGDKGDLDAEDYAKENEIEDYEIEWDDYEKGYRMTFPI